MPICVVASQARNLEPEHDPGLADPDLGHEALEALPVCSRGAGVALIAVDDDDLLRGPAERAPRCRSAYWRCVDSVLLTTWRSVDCRTYR